MLLIIADSKKTGTNDEALAGPFHDDTILFDSGLEPCEFCCRIVLSCWTKAVFVSRRSSSGRSAWLFKEKPAYVVIR
jgi:hypothetical protein